MTPEAEDKADAEACETIARLLEEHRGDWPGFLAAARAALPAGSEGLIWHIAEALSGGDCPRPSPLDAPSGP